MFSSASPSKPVLIVAFGDSLTAGYGLNAKDAFPAQLERKLLSDGKNVQIINEGISGNTVADGLTRLPKVLAHKPEIVILALGANDMLRGIPPATTRQGLEEIIKQLKAANIDVLLAGMRMPLNWGMPNAQAFNDVFSDLADEYELEFYPHFLEGVGGRRDMNLPDGVHPTAAGIAIMVDGIYPHVETVYDDAAGK